MSLNQIVLERLGPSAQCGAGDVEYGITLTDVEDHDMSYVSFMGPSDLIPDAPASSAALARLVSWVAWGLIEEVKEAPYAGAARVAWSDAVLTVGSSLSLGEIPWPLKDSFDPGFDGVASLESVAAIALAERRSHRLDTALPAQAPSQAPGRGPRL